MKQNKILVNILNKGYSDSNLKKLFSISLIFTKIYIEPSFYTNKEVKNINNELKLTSPMPPSVNHYLSYRAIMKNGKPMAMSYKTQDATKYQKEFTKYVKQQVKEQNWIMSDNRFQHYKVDAVFYFPRIDMDCNNYWKCCFDSITESACVWLDDTQACENVKAIYYDSLNPRIELIVRPVLYIGIFENHTQLEEFESNCIHCTRYKEGKCSLLVKSKEGRIQPEIADLKCEKYKPTKL